jgi:hypothetical protein
MAFLYGYLVLHVVSAIAIVFATLGIGLMGYDWWIQYVAL